MADLESSEEKFGQQTENELKKMKLAAEHGAVFGNAAFGDIVSPEIEGQFLDYVEEWERQYALRKTISVYDLVGRPEWKPLAELDDEQVVVELERVHWILMANSIVLETLCEVEERELYRFITEELFKLEVDDIRIPGMRHSFIYEEFHPNHSYDIKNRIVELVEHLIDKSSGEMIPWGLDDKVMYRGVDFTKEEFNDQMLQFRASFDSLDLVHFRFVTIDVDEAQKVATVVCYMEHRGLRGDTLVEHSGDCKFSLSLHYEWWEINEVEFGFGL